MKITDPQVIKNGEKDLIASVQEDLDPETVREILKERMAVAALESKGGQIVVHDNEIAFRLDFEVNLSGSLLFDRDGNLIEDQAADDEHQDLLIGSEIGPDLDLENDLDDDLMDDSLEGLEDIAPARNLTADPVDDLDEESTDDLTIDFPNDMDDDLDDISNKLDEDLYPELEELINNESLTPEEQAPENKGSDDSGPKELDDDINDILKESREFWEQKEDS